MINNFVIYGLESFLVSVILFTGYRLIRDTSSPVLNRFYLLGCVLFAVLLPLMDVEFSRPNLPALDLSQSVATFYEPSVMEPIQEISNNDLWHPEKALSTNKAESNSLNWESLIILIYLLVSLLFLVRLLLGVLSIIIMQRKSNVKYHDGGKFYEVNNNSLSGASFFNWIFIGKQYVGTTQLGPIFYHELIHTRRYHSFDILLADIFRIIFWWNPVAWLLRQQIRLNAEFEVDHEMTNSFEKKEYSNLLINLSISPTIRPLYTSFSATSVKKRLIRMHSNRANRWVFNGGLMVILTVFTFWLVSCSDTVSSENILTITPPFSDVRTITTHFTSHQSDTQEKSDRIVAIAYFSTEQTLDQFEQHMTYPYTMEAPEKRRFWAQPDATKVQLIMDGLDLGHAENNILYGNDWPAKFAKVVEEGHPKFRNRLEVETQSFVDYDASGFPLEISTIQQYELAFSTSTTWIEKFKYQDGKIIEYQTSQDNGLTPERLKKYAMADRIRKIDDVVYTYEGDLLSGIQNGKQQLKFLYEGELLTRSEFYLNGTMYNYRNYFYNESGLKTRTEIFNVNGEAEYTIHYDYEFYELTDASQ